MRQSVGTNLPGIHELGDVLHEFGDQSVSHL